MTGAKHTPMVVAAARELCRQHAEVCQVNEHDAWNTYAEDFKADAQKALTACGALEVLEALVRVDAALRAAWSAGNLPASVLPGELASMCGAAIAKATGGAA